MDVAPILGVGCDPVQLDAFRDDSGRLASNVYQLNRVNRGPGRRPGSKNRSTSEYARLAIHKFGDPRDYLGSLWSTPLDQGVELVLAAENYAAREERLLRLCDDASRAMVMATKKNWSAVKLKVVAQMVDAVERAASAMKAKPGDIAIKILQLQVRAAKEHAQYVGSKMPMEVRVNDRPDVILNIGGITDSKHLAEIIGEHGVSDDEISQIGVTATVAGDFADFEEIEPDDDLDFEGDDQ